MGRVKQPYGPWSRTMLEALRKRGLLKMEAFLSWLGERDIHVDRTLISHWVAGSSHLPADLLPRLSAFTGHPELVFGEYLRAVGCEVVRMPEGRAEDRELVELMLEAGSTLGRLHRGLVLALAPDSPGGRSVTREESGELRRGLDDFIQQLMHLRALLAQRERV